MNNNLNIIKLMNQQINPLKTIQNLVATNGNLLEESEMRELEAYADHQLRMCEIILKLAKSIDEKESEKVNEKKTTPQKKEDFDYLLG